MLYIYKLLFQTIVKAEEKYNSLITEIFLLSQKLISFFIEKM